MYACWSLMMQTDRKSSNLDAVCEQYATFRESFIVILASQKYGKCSTEYSDIFRFCCQVVGFNSVPLDKYSNYAE
jgi:hypothetical protein